MLESLKFATKPQLAPQMLTLAIMAGIRPAWLVADEVYDNDGSFGRWLEKSAKQPYVLTVNKKQHTVVIGWQRYRAEDLLPEPDTRQWQRFVELGARGNDTMIGRLVAVIKSAIIDRALWRRKPLRTLDSLLRLTLPG